MATAIARFEAFLDRMTQVCSFLAGISFTCLLLLVQRREIFPYVVTILNLHVQVALEIVAIPLAITFAFFIFATFCHAAFYGRKDRKEMEKLYNKGFTLFFLGFLTMFVSLFFILLLISFWVAVLGMVAVICVFIYWLA